jgi:hypothetical protein
MPGSFHVLTPVQRTTTHTPTEARVLVYADTADYESYTKNTAPDNAHSLLREASILVTNATRGDVYEVQANGLPADDDKLDALRNATCSQAESWSTAGLDPVRGPGGQDQRLTTSAIDGASLSFDTHLTAPQIVIALKSLSDSALRILRNAGLASAAVGSS